MGSCEDFPQALSSGAADFFERLQLITPLERLKMFDFIVFIQLVMNLEAYLEESSNRSKLPRFPVKSGPGCAEYFWQHGFSALFIIDISRVPVAPQFLRRQPNLICFNRRRNVFTEQLSIWG